MNTAAENSEKRIVPLECLRGIAALVVFFWHFLIAFLPNRSGFFKDFPQENGLIGGLLFIPFNGLAAVSFFFVLSGFVLTYRFFQTGNPFLVVRGILKRWPRLIGLVTVAVLLSWLCFALGLYFYADAGALTGSPYLQKFAFAKQGDHFIPSLDGALMEGLFTFFRGDTAYSSNLWSMRPELLGSYLAFSLAFIFAALKNRMAVIALAIIVIPVFHFIDPVYTAFVVGVLIAYFYVHRGIRISPLPAVIMLAFALFLFGFLFPRGLYRYFTGDLLRMRVEALRTYMHIAAAVLMMIVILGFRPFYNCLTGRWARLLGEISFPLYLLQTTVICSFSSWFFLKLNGVFSHPLLVGMDFFATLVIIFILSFYLGRFDRFWVFCINQAARRFITNSRHEHSLPDQHEQAL